MSADVLRLNELRLARTHLEAQLDAGVDTPWGTQGEAAGALKAVDAELATLEKALKRTSGCAYLFGRRRGRR